MKFFEQDKIYTEIYDIILYKLDTETMILAQDQVAREITENIINSDILEIKLK